MGALIRNLATDLKNRELFTRLVDHRDILPAEVEAVIAAQLGAKRGAGRGGRNEARATVRS
jgi:hypothetical protein